MLSNDQFIDVGDSRTPDSLVDSCWGKFVAQNELQAVMVVRFDIKKEAGEVVWAFNLPVEAFNGSENCHLLKAIKECFLVHPKPHVHSMKHDGLADILCRFNRNIKAQYRMWFYPVSSGGKNFIVLAFPHPENGKALPADLKEQLSVIFTTLDGCLRSTEMHNRLAVTEKFLREVGHDVASAVQASVAKIRNISEGRVTGGGIAIKAREIEQEIWSIYRTAESLGIIADPDYELKLTDDFDLNAIVKTVIKHFYSEAEERHLRLRLNPQKDPIFMWGEKAAIQQAIGQLVFNAIKYSFGGNDIIIATSERELDFVIRITNKGHPLPEGPDLKKIWDFGFRGKLAKELHVNGSGIGLYTVKKIVTAHVGWVDACSSGGFTDFYVHIPKKAAMKRDLGILL